MDMIKDTTIASWIGFVCYNHENADYSWHKIKKHVAALNTIME